MKCRPPNQTVNCELVDELLTIRLCRPDRLNAVNEDVYEDLHWVLDQLEPATRAVTLQGEGRAFCAGADLKRHALGRSPAEMRAYLKSSQDLFRRLLHLPIPVVAGIHGFALGAGAELALVADFLIVGESAVLGFPEVSLGTFVGGGVTSRLSRAVGPYEASRALLLGESLDAQRLSSLRLAYDVCPDDELDERTRTLAEKLASLPGNSVALAKDGIRRAGQSIEDVLLWEEQAMFEAVSTQEWAVGVKQFAKRRAAKDVANELE